MKIIPAKVYSVQQEISLSLQWIALLSGELDIHFAAATGIHDGKGVIKQLLAGARATQLCSTLYRNGISHIQRILVEVEEWMNRHNFRTIDEFRGKLSRENVRNPEIFERSQYIKALVGIS
jgi:dihydroorotate dehydrogenase (fumarate)